MPKNQAAITCVSVLVCDDFFRDIATQKLAIWGTFNEVSAAVVPARHPRLCVLVTLTNGRGVRNIGISIERASDREAVIEIGGPMVFKSPLDIVEVGIVLQQLVFQTFGKYWVCVKENGEIRAQRPFLVRKLKKPKKQRGSGDERNDDQRPSGPSESA